MSATRDKSQKIAFVYSNLYQVYRKGKEAAETAGASVLKTEDLNQVSTSVTAFSPMELIGKRVERPEVIASPLAAAPKLVVADATKSAPEYANRALDSLKENLKSLNDLHSRLRFMLKELEDLVENN